MSDPARVTRLLPAAVVMAAVCLFAAELMTTFEFAPPDGVSIDLQRGSERHGWALAVIALFAIAALMVAVLAASKPAATAVAAAGLAALAIFLLADLPDANAVGALDDDGRSFFDAEAIPRDGFWLEMLGSLGLAISGIALATLTPAQLATLRPQGNGGESRRRAAARDRTPSTHEGDAEEPKRRAPRRPRGRAHSRGRR